MVGWLREEILRDSSYDATTPDGRIDYVHTFHRSTESIRTLVNEMPGRGEDVDGVYVHAAALHVGVQRSATYPGQVAVVLTGIDPAFTTEDWKAVIDFLSTVLKEVLQRPQGKRQTRKNLEKDLSLWQSYQESGSYKSAADRWLEESGEVIDGPALQKAVGRVERRFSPLSAGAEDTKSEQQRKVLVISTVSGPRSYRTGGFPVDMPEIRVM